MLKANGLTKLLVFAILTVALWANLAISQEIRPPGLCLDLFHVNHDGHEVGTGDHVWSLPREDLWLVERHGGDIGLTRPWSPVIGNYSFSRVRAGFNWYEIRGSASIESWRLLPPGLVFGLAHFKNTTSSGSEEVNFDPVNETKSLVGFMRRHGGDRGAHRDVGFYWIESIDTGNTSWNLIDQLPRDTVVGLRHFSNLTRPTFFWPHPYSCTFELAPAECDCTNLTVNPPPGFARFGFVDYGARKNHGFC